MRVTPSSISRANFEIFNSSVWRINKYSSVRMLSKLFSLQSAQNLSFLLNFSPRNSNVSARNSSISFSNLSQQLSSSRQSNPRITSRIWCASSLRFSKSSSNNPSHLMNSSSYFLPPEKKIKELDSSSQYSNHSTNHSLSPNTSLKRWKKSSESIIIFVLILICKLLFSLSHFLTFPSATQI